VGPRLGSRDRKRGEDLNIVPQLNSCSSAPPVEFSAFHGVDCIIIYSSRKFSKRDSTGNVSFMFFCASSVDSLREQVATVMLLRARLAAGAYSCELIEMTFDWRTRVGPSTDGRGSIFVHPTQPTMLTQGHNPTCPSHTYVKCRHQYCRTHMSVDEINIRFLVVHD